MQQENEVVAYTEAARMLGVPVGTLYSMVARQQIPHLRLGPRTVRFERRALLAWLEGRRVAVTGGGAL